MKKVNPELGLVLIIFLIAAMLNFLAASQHMALMFYFLPTLYSAYRFGRRHATLTACASVALVVLLTYLNPGIFNRQAMSPFESRWFDLTAWGGILVVSGYAMGTLYERNQKSLNEMKTGYDGMLAVLQSALASQRSESHTARVSHCAMRIGECLGLDGGSMEDVRIAALLHNVNEAGVSNEILFKAANLSEEEISRFQMRGVERQEGIGGSLQRVIPIVVAGQQLTSGGGDLADAPIEVQVVAMAEEYESLVGKKNKSADEAQEMIALGAGKKYDSLIVDALKKAFAPQTSAAKA
jgi:HD-GYP domain-containing protein (c-di-GMP phosphodiesterase class II)